MTERNKIFLGLDGCKIDIHITASSEEQARKMYEAIEKSLIEALRIDLETDWERDDEGGDRRD